MSIFEGKENKEEPLSDKVRKQLEGFLSRSDDPGEFLSDEEKDKLREATLTDPDALKKWEKNRNNKYRTNSLSVISWAELFLLSEETKNVPIDQKEKLLRRIKKADEEIEKEKPSGYSKELVDEIVDIVNEVKKYL